MLIPWPLDARAEDPALDWGIRAPAPGEPLRYTYLSRDLSGHVVASLATGVESGALAAADTIRCRFELADPSRGLVGGGRGSCTVSDGGRIDVRF